MPLYAGGDSNPFPAVSIYCHSQLTMKVPIKGFSWQAPYMVKPVPAMMLPTAKLMGSKYASSKVFKAVAVADIDKLIMLVERISVCPVTAIEVSINPVPKFKIAEPVVTGLKITPSTDMAPGTMRVSDAWISVKSVPVLSATGIRFDIKSPSYL
jgi:hypothetical protein